MSRRPSPSVAVRRLRMEAVERVKANDPEGALVALRAALRLQPSSPGIRAQIASAEATAGRPAAAVAALDGYARLGLTLDLSTRPELAALQTRADFAPVAARLAVNAAPRGRVLWRRDIEGAGPLEGVAVDPATDRTWISLIGDRSILVADRNGPFRIFAGAEVLRGGPFGLVFDRPRNRLWVAVANGPDVPGSDRAVASSELVEIDAADGRVVARRPAPGSAHQLGDVALGADGTVFVSDGLGGAVFRLKPRTADLEALPLSPALSSTQGMALLNRETLIVADYPTGLHRVDLRNGRTEPVKIPAETALGGIDGLVLAGGRLYVSQNGVTPHRLLRLQLSSDGRRVMAVRVVLANARGAGDLALLAAKGDTLVLAADSRWAGVDGSKPPAGRPALAAVPMS